MGQKILKPYKKEHYQLSEKLTREGMKQYLKNENFVFKPDYYYSIQCEYNKVFFSACSHKDYYYDKYTNLDEILDKLIRCANVLKKSLQDAEIRTEIMPRIKNLVNLGFAPDIDYSDFSYDEIKEKLRVAKEKQQEYIGHVMRLGKLIQEKEENRALQEAETIIEEGQK